MQRRLRTLVAVSILTATPSSTLRAQEHVHLPPASGMPHGMPRFCAQATITSIASGAWSNPAVWSTNNVPVAGDGVLIEAGTMVTYDAVSDAALTCVDVAGTLTFRPDTNTRMKVGTLTVLRDGVLEIGTVTRPVAPTVTAELIVADRPLDTKLDPEQYGTGLIGFGTVRIHGARKSPTFVRLAAEPLAGSLTLTLEQAVTGWRAGDKLVLPDTRQLRYDERSPRYKPQWEELHVESVADDVVGLSTPLAFNHRGGRNGDGALEFLPHVGNLSRNVIIRSDNPAGTRGHAIFIERPDVDIRYALFKALGRTRMGVLDNTEWASDGTVRRVGANQIGRYPIHFHHSFGPNSPRADGYQFTLIGNAVDDASKWGITIHNSHHGLLQENVVYHSHGAAIVAEDGTESFNVFERNFAVRSEGSGEFAPRSGYSGAGNDPGGEGAGFWLRGPNNILRGNVATNVDVFGYAVAAGSIGAARIPKYRGADTSRDGEYDVIDTTDAPLLEFSANEAYGAMQTGLAIGWNGTLRNSRIWHTSRHAVTAFPTDRLTIDGFVARGDPAVLQAGFENPVGIWFTNYAAKTVTVRGADVQGMRVGVASPFFGNTDVEPGRGDGVATIENSYFRDYVGVAVATAYSPNATTVPGTPIKKAIVRGSRFEPLTGVPASQYPPAAISMNYGMSAGDTTARDPVLVYDFNRVSGDTFRVFYSSDLPASAAPACNAARPEIGGFVCAGDGTR